MTQEDKNISGFIEEVLKIQNTNVERKLDINELQLIAVEMGMTDSEWNQLLETFNGHLTRAKGYLNYSNYEDAISELSQASKFVPHHAETYYLLAICYKHKWYENTKNSDFELALNYAIQCADIEPEHSGALELISALRQSNFAPKKLSRLKIAVIVLVILAFITFAVISIFERFQTKMSVEPEQDIIINMDDIQEDNVDIGDESLLPQPAGGIPVFLDQSTQTANLKMQIESSQFEAFDKAYSYTLKVDLIPTDVEINALTLKIEIFDKNNKVIITDSRSLSGKNSINYRNNDIIPVGLAYYRDANPIPQLGEVRLSIEYIEKEDASAKYNSSNSVEVQWAITKPSNFDIQVRQRQSSFTKRSSGGFYHYLVFEAQNTGNTSISALETEIRWYNKKNKLVETKQFFLNTTSEPRIKRNQTRLSYGTWEVKDIDTEEFEKIVVTVISVE